MKQDRTRQALAEENADLRSRLAEAEETLRAIREGEVDAVIVTGSRGDRVFALSEAENLHRLMVETMNEAGLAITPDGVVLFCNQRACDILQRSKESLLGHDLGSCVAAADRDPFRALLRSAGTGSADRRILFVSGSGSDVPMHVWASHLKRAEGTVLCLVATDISRLEFDRSMIARLQDQQRLLYESQQDALELAGRSSQAEQRLARTNAQLETLLAQAPVGIAYFDRELRYVIANDRLAAMNGIPRDAHLGRHVGDVVPFMRPLAERVTARIVETGHPVRDLEATGETALAPGMQRYWSQSWYPVHGPDGDIVGFGVIVEEITDRKRAEQTLYQTLDELRRSNHDLEQFAHVASHDLKEPMRMVTAFTGLLRDEYEDRLDSRGLEYIRFAADAATRMQELIDDLLSYARVGRTGRPVAAVDVAASLQRALEQLRISIDETGARITIEALPWVRANPVELVQVFQNLISNAIKFRDNDRPAEVHVSACRTDAVVPEHHGPPQPGWLFAVKDNGIGIDVRYADQVFAIFQQLHTREDYPGSGVGLAICKKIVERHGGRIWFESEPGVGTTFYFTLPDA